ncbi:MAG: EAL domain-containing protein [Pseudomonadota bacterium]|nr:EAL domain-containing protein [Pseudomonadota bacterium]
MALGLSRKHACLQADDDGDGDALVVVDLGSTNGTFVNRQRIEAAQVLRDNDIVHFGSAELRLRDVASETSSPLAPNDERTIFDAGLGRLSEHFVANESEFRALLHGDGLACALQPIVAADSGAVVAYELLGRGTQAGLPQSPVHLFHLAARLHLETELSTAFREHGVDAVAGRLGGRTLFVNAHPTETFGNDFTAGLERLLGRHPGLDLVVEIHETAVVELKPMRELARRLAGLGIRFAYDDFGAGQARLQELADVPAHFVKFDMSLVRGIDTASEKRQRIVFELVRLVGDLGSIALAEGVESEAEAATCRSMGFKLLQGFLTGRPIAIGATASGPSSESE